MPPRGRPARPPLVAVVVVILTVVEDDLRVLLIRRSAPPFRDYWALPGGLLPDGETLDRAATRKLLEETGLQDVYLEQLYTFGELPQADASARDAAAATRRPAAGRSAGTKPARSAARPAAGAPDAAPRLDAGARRGVVVTYFALVQYERARLRDSEAWRPAWHSAYRSPPLAFDNNVVVDYAIRRLRSKLEYTNVAYSLVPRQFTLSELQAVYEAILARELDKRNFRRRMLSLGVIRPAGVTRKEGAHRPAQLFTFVKREPVVV